MAGLVKSAMLPKGRCCTCEDFLREHSLQVLRAALSAHQPLVLCESNVYFLS
ncbi:MAG: hypothetical protein OSA51_14175 [Octadecabacter sp.]|nr:hypothetical protein [Octadecabacter sp.]